MKTCLICGNEIDPFISFGQMPIANGFLKREQFKEEAFFELKVAFCEKCQMVQLTEFVEREKMFHENYAFFSSTSRRMEKHFEEFSAWIQENYLDENPFVVEIGSNDGIMLKNFARKNIKHLGVEPSANVAEEAIKNGVNTISEFFEKKTAEKIEKSYGKADVIQGANVMCHIPYIHSIFEGVESLLKLKGVLVFEDPYLGDIIEKTSYDQIYDEHAFYFSATSVSNLAKMHGLQLIDVLPQNTHGGSMRYVIGRTGERKVNRSVDELIKKENVLGLHLKETYNKFKSNVEESRRNLMNLLNRLRDENKVVVGYGATSKSTTVMNYCGITTEHLKFISDTTPTKIGKYSPGAHIPIEGYESFKQNYPQYALLFAWNHGEEIMEKEKDFLRSGGKFIIYVPEVKVI